MNANEYSKACAQIHATRAVMKQRSHFKLHYRYPHPFCTVGEDYMRVEHWPQCGGGWSMVTIASVDLFVY